MKDIESGMLRDERCYMRDDVPRRAKYLEYQGLQHENELATLWTWYTLGRARHRIVLSPHRNAHLL